MSAASSAPEVTTQHREGHLDGAAGKQIYWQAWLPEAGDPKGVVVIAHGASEHGGRYRYVVERLVPEDFAVYAIDHRGHGRSGKGAQLDRMDHVISDLDQLIDTARREHPDTPLFLLGHSMGGCIATTYAFRHQAKLDGLALSSPLAALDAAPRPLRLLAQGLSAVAPNLGLVGVEAEGISRDPGEVADYVADPLNHHGKLPARTVQELAVTIGRLESGAPKLDVPLLVMLGTADTLCPPEGGRMLHDRASSADKELKVYEGYYHELFNEPPGERDKPLDDLAAWLNRHAS
jgi:alpha-beta hydrolase superfamily lysophospholipase